MFSVLYSYWDPLFILNHLHNEVLSPITKRRKGRCHFSPKINLFNIPFYLESVDLNAASLIHSSEMITRLRRCRVMKSSRQRCVKWCQYIGILSLLDIHICKIWSMYCKSNTCLYFTNIYIAPLNFNDRYLSSLLKTWIFCFWKLHSLFHYWIMTYHRLDEIVDDKLIIYDLHATQ